MERRCDICKNLFPIKKLKRINGWRCLECNKQKRKEKREYLKREVLGIKKRSDLLKEWKEKREFQKRLIKTKDLQDIKNKKSNNYFTQIEKQFLFRKYYNQGLEKEEIILKIKQNKEYLNNFVKDLIIKKTNEENLDKKFKEEFSKLICQTG
jgi:hypothetical protein